MKSRIPISIHTSSSAFLLPLVAVVHLIRCVQILLDWPETGERGCLIMGWMESSGTEPMLREGIDVWAHTYTYL